MEVREGERFADWDRAGQHFDIFNRKETPRTAGWVMCWSDLMMTMFIMFAALYMFAVPTIQVKAVQELPPRPVSAAQESMPPVSAPGSILERVHDRLRDRIEQAGLGGLVSVHIVPEKTVHLILAGDGLFAAGGLALRPDASAALLSLADILQSAPQVLAVVGHVAPGEPLYGQAGPWELSVARATGVAGVLTREAGLPAARMFVVGYGDQRPGTAMVGQSRGGRVELVLCAESPTEPLPGAAAPAADGFRSWIAASKEGGN
jgi:outer membrane protein OmpA-like peptidoglycan-associated protein